MSDKNHTTELETADEMLNNILDSCNIPPSSDSLETIMQKRMVEKLPLHILKIVSVVFLVISVLVPLAFKKDPSFDVINSSKTVAVTSHTLYEDCFVMTLSGLADYANIYSKKSNGAIIYPDIIDQDAGLVIFPYNGESLNIYIPTTSGECIQAVLHEPK